MTEIDTIGRQDIPHLNKNIAKVRGGAQWSKFKMTYSKVTFPEGHLTKFISPGLFLAIWKFHLEQPA